MYNIIFNILYSNRFLTSYYLHKLKWLGVSSRIYYRFLCLIKKVIISGLPSYLSTLLSEKITGYSRRYPMQLEEALCRLQITKRSFMMYAASMWNKLPLAIRSAPYI